MRRLATTLGLAAVALAFCLTIVAVLVATVTLPLWMLSAATFALLAVGLVVGPRLLPGISRQDLLLD